MPGAPAKLRRSVLRMAWPRYFIYDGGSVILEKWEPSPILGIPSILLYCHVLAAELVRTSADSMPYSAPPRRGPSRFLPRPPRLSMVFCEFESS